MLNNLKVSVVIPTLNEAEGIAQTLKLIPQCVDEVVVVDGNSHDQTREIAQKNGAKVVLEKRRGYGRAFKTGFAAASGDIIATADGDGTYPIELLEKVFSFMQSQNCDFVSCSRLPLEDASSMRKRNLIGNHLMTVAASTLWMHSFSDILSGMWVFKKDCLKKLELHSDSWNFSEEIKLQAHMHLKEKFKEFKVPYRERLGETKLIPWKVGLQNLGYMLAMRTNTVSSLQALLKKEKPVLPS